MKAPEAPQAPQAPRKPTSPQIRTALEAFRFAINTLRKAGVPDPEIEAEAIFKELLGLDLLKIYRDNPDIIPAQKRKLEKVLLRRKKREPLQYIIGHVDFMGLEILVGKGVLIPRPETELVTKEALDLLSPKKNPEILELCSGSGAIALALARNLPRSEVLAVEISEKALKYAKKNKKLNKIKNVKLLKGNLYGPVKGKLFDLIIANPPYIEDKLIKTLAPEVKDWEPLVALRGGPDGLEIIRKIINGAPGHLKPGGILVLELASGMGKKVLSPLAKRAGLKDIQVKKDFAGLTRIFSAHKP